MTPQDEDEKDTEDVNFNDMMLDDEARKAVKSKRGIRHGNEYSDRLYCIFYGTNIIIITLKSNSKRSGCRRRD